MARLSDPAARLFAFLPASYGTDPDDCDPIVARWLEALAFELDRIRAVLLALRFTSIPVNADDSVGSLSRWEKALKLPVAPDATVAQRRAALLARLRGRRVAAGSDWTAAIGPAAGPGWQVYENTPGANQLTIETAYPPDSYQAGQLRALVEAKSPANQQIVYSYLGGFEVGASRVGDAIR